MHAWPARGIYISIFVFQSCMCLYMHVCTHAYGIIYIYTVKLVYNNTLGASKMCCYNQVVVVTRTLVQRPLNPFLSCVLLQRG